MRDLRVREETTLENIGRARIAPDAGALNCAPSEAGIAAWARTKNWDAVIWTALKTDFQEKTMQPFSVHAALSHVKTLTVEGQVKAAAYVWRAPEFMQTPVRSALQTEPRFLDAGRT
jgi:hypothetical protein